jgi:hypothetical protein
MSISLFGPSAVQMEDGKRSAVAAVDGVRWLETHIGDKVSVRFFGGLLTCCGCSVVVR